MDDCGNCAIPGSNKWNDCKINFATLDVYEIDKIQSDYVQVRFYNDDIVKPKEGEVTTAVASTCKLIGKTANYSFGSVQKRQGFLKLGIEDPPPGSYKVRCQVSSVVVETGANDILSIYDSLDVEIVNAKITDGTERDTKQVNLTTNLNHPDLRKVEKVYCFYRKAKNLQGGLMPNAKFTTDKSRINCGEFTPNGGGVYQFGVLLVNSKHGVKHPDLNIVEEVITTGGPKVKKAFFKNNYGAVAIKFSTNIQGVPKDCKGVFSQNIFGSNPECSGKANVLLVRLDADNKVNNGSKITLKPGNGIKELKSEEDYSPEAKGQCCHDFE